jgi:hypothetical protein
MYRMVIPIRWMQGPPTKPTRRSNYNREFAVEAYFAVLTVVILAMIVGIVTYAVQTAIPAWQRSLSSGSHTQRFEFGPHSSRPR